MVMFSKLQKRPFPLVFKELDVQNIPLDEEQKKSCIQNLSKMIKKSKYPESKTDKNLSEAQVQQRKFFCPKYLTVNE